MVRSHAAGADASERQAINRQVHDGIVDQNAAARCLCEELFVDPFVLGEDVHRQRLFPVVDQVHGLLGTANANQGKNRTEYLLLHYGIVETDVQ